MIQSSSLVPKPSEVGGQDSDGTITTGPNQVMSGTYVAGSEAAMEQSYLSAATGGHVAPTATGLASLSQTYGGNSEESDSDESEARTEGKGHPAMEPSIDGSFENPSGEDSDAPVGVANKRRGEHKSSGYSPAHKKGKGGGDLNVDAAKQRAIALSRQAQFA